MIKTISPQDAAKWLAAGDAILIDVREADEFQAEHIAYANSLPLSNLDNLFSQLDLPETRKIIIHCFRGKRGEQACVNLKTHSPRKNEVYNLEGGITAWKNVGLPVVGSAPVLSVFRQVQIVIGSLIALCVVLGFMGFILGFVLAGMLGAALFFAGVTGWCGLAILLKKMPWNK